MKRALTALVTLAFLAGCGSDPSQEEARDQATEASCDRAERCNEIGEGRDFADRDDCEVKAAAFWNERWSKEVCDGNMRSEDLDRCLDAIEDTSCDNIFDVGNTLENRCSRALVCAGNTED